MADVLARGDPMFSERDTTTTTSNRSSRHASGMSSPVMSKAQVVYYLSRGGKMEPPHMIEVPHSPYDGLRLKDVKHRLTVLRGGGMPNMFSWSCKRMYKNTHIWQDVCDEDTLTPVSGGEYVLKGSEYFESNQGDRSLARNPEILQRKFRGAETWLKASAAAGTPVQSSSRDHNSQPPVHHAYESRPPDNYNMANHLKNLSMDAAAAVKRPVMEAEAEYNVKVPNGGTSSEESGMHDIGVCEVSRSRAAGARSEHGCNVGPQAEDMRYSYGTSSQDYSKSGSSTPNCNAGDRNQPMYRQQQQQQQQRLATNVEGTMPVGKASKPRKSKGRLSRRFSHSQGKESGPNVKMKQSAASCVFLHILSYCGGVETKAQRSSPPTEVASSEYSFDGLCSAESKLPSQTRSPQYSMELHKEQLAYQAVEVNRSGPLIPYSSEYFDVKETVTPPPASPLQPGKASKAASSFQEMEETEEEEVAGAELGRPSDADSVGPRPLLGGQDDETLTRAGSSRRTAAATVDQRSMWNSKLRLSKRKFLRQWWQVLLQGLQAKTFTGRLRPAERRSTGTRRFFLGSRSRSRRVRRRAAQA